MNNGLVRSGLLDSTGCAAPASAMWQAPSGQSPYFGWMGEEGFTTVRIDSIKAITPDPRYRGRALVWIESNMNLVINAEDLSRLMKRMGWREPGSERT